MSDIEILSQDNFEEEDAILAKLFRKREIEKLTDLKTPTCLLGETVIHRSYGKGIAFEFSEDFKCLEIMFNGVGAKKFIFPEAFNMGLKFEAAATQSKIEELILDVPRIRSGLKYDPVEDTERYLKIEDEVNNLVQERMGGFRGIGSCHLFWSIKKEILKEKYGIEWKCPSELNPHVMFD